MTIQEVIEDVGEENYDILIIEEGTKFESAVEIAETAVNFETDNAIDWVVNDETRELKILVQPVKAIKYVHVGAPAPQYAISSINRIHGAILQAASKAGIYAREEKYHDHIQVDVILEPDVTDDQVAEMFMTAKKGLEDDGYTGVDASDWSLSYDAGTASIEDAEPSRNW